MTSSSWRACSLGVFVLPVLVLGCGSRSGVSSDYYVVDTEQSEPDDDDDPGGAGQTGRGGDSGHAGGYGGKAGGKGGAAGRGAAGRRAGSAGGAGSAGSGVVPSCNAISHQGHGVPTDLYFLVDRSRSMNAISSNDSLTKWEAIGAALDQFLWSDESAGLGAGLGFLPVGSDGSRSCDVRDYAVPNVPIGILPGVATKIADAISSRPVMSGTPTAHALEGAFAYARERQTDQPNRDVAVLLVTDGLPNSCGDSLDAAIAAAAAGTSGSPRIRTYVLGVGTNLNNLNAIASAGGTSNAYLVESGGVDELVTALNAIRVNTISCDYALPNPVGGALDYGSATVQTRVGVSGTALRLQQLSSASRCASTLGWYYDRNPTGGARPTKLSLCPAACKPLLDTPGSVLDIVITCNPEPSVR